MFMISEYPNYPFLSFLFLFLSFSVSEKPDFIVTIFVMTTWDGRVTYVLLYQNKKKNSNFGPYKNHNDKIQEQK